MEGRSSNARRNNKKKKKSKSARKERLQQRLGSRGSLSESPARQQPPPVSVVLQHADASMERSDLSTALQLYSHAIEALKTTLSNNDDDDVDGDAAMISERNVSEKQKQSEGRLQLAKVFGKRGEALVSMEDREAARSDFQCAVDLLSSEDSARKEITDSKQPDNGDAEMTDANDDTKGAVGPKNGAGDSRETVQWYEVRAGLNLFLGQLSSGDEGALQFYRSGISDYRSALENLRSTFSPLDASDDRQAVNELASELRRKLCGAYCSVAELYLTDLCFEPDAEQQCEESIQAAQQVEASSTIPLHEPDVPQTLANLRVSQGRVDEATELLLEAFGRMRGGCEALSNLVGLGPASSSATLGGEEPTTEMESQEAKELVNVEAADSLPGFEFRSQTAKLLLECASSLQASLGEQGSTMATTEKDALERRAERCVQASVLVLGSLLAENDEVIETWYLLGCAFVAAKNEEAARDYLERALEMLSTIKSSLEKECHCKAKSSMGGSASDGDELQEEIRDITSRMRDVEKKLAELPKS